MYKYPSIYKKTFIRSSLSFFLVILIAEAILSYFYYPLVEKEIDQKFRNEIKKSWNEFLLLKQNENYNIVKGYAWWNEISEAVKFSNKKLLVDNLIGDKSFKDYYDIFLVVNEDTTIVYGVIDSVYSNLTKNEFEQKRNPLIDKKMFSIINDFDESDEGFLRNKEKSNAKIWHNFIYYNEKIRLVTLSALCDNNGYPITKGYFLIGQDLNKIIAIAEKIIPAKFYIKRINEENKIVESEINLPGLNESFILEFYPDISAEEISNRTILIFFSIQIIIICLAFIIVFPFYMRKGVKRLESIIEDQTKELNDRQIELKNYVEELYESKDLIENNANELIQMNYKLEESEEQLKELNKRKDKFFSIIAHDLRGPLGGVIGLIQFLKSEFNTQSEEDKMQLLSTIETSGQNINELLENLLNWAKSQLQENEVVREELKIKNIINFLCDIYAPNIFDKKIKIINNIPDHYTVFGNHEMIETVFRNLLNNAVKFTYVNGSISFDMRSDENYKVITISDTGIGIDEKNINKIFEFDNPIKSVGTAGEPGTGLGLALCKELIEKNNGDIWVESEVEKGSTFFIKLPNK